MLIDPYSINRSTYKDSMMNTAGTLRRKTYSTPSSPVAASLRGRCFEFITRTYRATAVCGG